MVLLRCITPSGPLLIEIVGFMLNKPFYTTMRIKPFYTSLSCLKQIDFVTSFINIGTWPTCLTTSARVETMDCAQFLVLFYWLQYRSIERLKREADHGESSIDGMHILVILLGFVDSMLYSVFAPDCKQSAGFSLFHSSPTVPNTRWM